MAKLKKVFQGQPTERIQRPWPKMRWIDDVDEDSRRMVVSKMEKSGGNLSRRPSSSSAVALWVMMIIRHLKHNTTVFENSNK